MLELKIQPLRLLDLGLDKLTDLNFKFKIQYLHQAIIFESIDWSIFNGFYPQALRLGRLKRIGRLELI